MAELRFPEQWLEVADAAEFLHVAPATLSNWRSERIGPPYLKGRPVLYAMSDLQAFLLTRRCDTTRNHPQPPAKQSKGA